VNKFSTILNRQSLEPLIQCKHLIDIATLIMLGRKSGILFMCLRHIIVKEEILKSFQDARQSLPLGTSRHYLVQGIQNNTKATK
jgi:hypothetical protein